MEIENACYSPLTNYEVLETLKLISKKDTKKKFGLRNLATITYETLQYLEETPSKSQTKDGIAGFLEHVRPFKLTKNEILMIVNDPPSTALHIQLLIEDSEERLSEDQVNQILGLVSKHLNVEES